MSVWRLPRRFSPALVFVCIGLGGGSPSMAGQSSPAESVQRGRKEFQQACGFCHGEDARGARGPDLIRSRLVNHDVNGNLIGPVIRSGRPDKGMPAFPFSDARIADITAFLHAQAVSALHSGHVTSDYPVERLLTGNPAAGKAFFYGAGGCDNCHSPTGDLQGVASKYSPIILESRFLYPAGKRPRVSVTLPSGKRVEGTLIHLDEFNVALRDSSGWYHSWPRNKVKTAVHDPLAAHRELLPKYTDADMHNLFAYLETLK